MEVRKILAGESNRKFRFMVVFLLLIGLAMRTAGCSDSGSSFEMPVIPGGCNPLASEWDCLLPFPSDHFLVDDHTMPGGKRLVLPENALITSDGIPVDLPGVHPADGFSHLSQILALFPSGVDPTNLVFHIDDVQASLGADSPTVLLEADTGQRVLHFAELDPRAEADDYRCLLIRPLVRLQNAMRYIVAIRGLRGHDGSMIVPPEGFRRIRDGQTKGHEVLGPLAEHYDSEIFPVIEAAGVDRADLQLAWDFTTETQENVTTDMLAVRDQVIEKLSAQPPPVTVTQVIDDVGPHIFRHVEGTIRVPLFMESPDPGARLHRDETGAVAANGEVDVEFTALIPRSVAERDPGDPPARVLQYGHGFFGSRNRKDELIHLVESLNKLSVVYVAVDWWGMSLNDLASIVETVENDPTKMLMFTDRVHQGMANFIALAYAVKGPLTNQPAFQMDGVPLYDPDHIYYYGNSQGHVLGGTYVALSPHIEKATLGVGGAGFSFIMFRSAAVGPYFVLFLEFYIPDTLDQQKWAALSQTVFDRIDPITYASHLLHDTYPDSPAFRTLLMHVGIGDAKVPNLAAHLHARALGLGHLQPAPREIPGIEPVDSPHDGSALVEFDFGVDQLPSIEADFSADNVVHEGVRKLDVAIRQIDLFFQPDGRIVHTCDGICDPE